MEYPVIIAMFQGEYPKSIFEVGCANGGLLKDVGTDIIVGGMDKHAGDLLRSKKLFPRDADNFFVGDLNDIPWKIKDKQYDVAFSVGTLLYLENPREVLKEMRRIAHKVFIAEPEQGLIETDHHGTRHYHDYMQILRPLGGKVKYIGLVASKSIFKWT